MSPSVFAALLPVSLSDPQIAPAAGGSGDSSSPIVSSNGRFVVFASTANNLLLNSNGVPIAANPLPTLNVYVRDRQANTTTLVSVNLAGTGGGNGDSWPRGVSTNGQYILFESAASNLVASDTNNQNDVFVRDMTAQTTFLVSVNTNGVSANGFSRRSVLTPDGRFVAFACAATDLVAQDTNMIVDVFVRDLLAGTTTLVSIGAANTNTVPNFQPGGSESDAPALTPNGRYVAFFSTASNVVPSLRSSGDVYVCDLVGATTTWASTNAQPIAQSILGTTNVAAYQPAISDDGQVVAFQVRSNFNPGVSSRGLILRYHPNSGLTDVVTTNANIPYQSTDNTHNFAMSPDGRFIAFVGNAVDNSGATTAVFLWDANTGLTLLASGDSIGNIPTNTICAWPSLDPTGRFVTFLSNATNLTANTLTGDFHLYLRDMLAGTTSLVDQDTNGIGTGVGWEVVPAISADGRFVAFEAADGDLVPNDSNRRDDVFLRDAVAQTNELISVRDPSLPGATPNGDSATTPLSLSYDGRFVAFSSEADNLSRQDHNSARDVYVRDLLTSSNILVSVDTNGAMAADNASTEPSISGDGRFVAFSSYADNLVPGDTNHSQDVFVRDLKTGQTVAVSVSADGLTLGNTNSFSPTISQDGRFILYHSKAQNLTTDGLNNGNENLFMRDMQSGHNYALTTVATGLSAGAGVGAASMTPDGRFVAFLGGLGSTSFKLYLWDSLAATWIYTNSTYTPSPVSISPNGHRLAFIAPGPNFTVVDLASNTVSQVSPGLLLVSQSGLRFSADSRFLVYSTLTNNSSMDTNGSADVYLYDIQGGTNLLVSRSFVAPGAADGSADAPDISADGRYIAYRSYATNTPAGNPSGLPLVLVYDRFSDSTSILSAGSTSGLAANSRSLAPLFSGDGRMIFFRSFASDLSGQDFNGNGDVFGYAFLYLSITASPTPGGGPILSWPVAPGETYLVQYKNHLTDSSWLPVSGTISIQGNRGSLTDLAPATGQRFYRVIANQP